MESLEKKICPQNILHMLAGGCFQNSSLIKAGSGVSIGGARQDIFESLFLDFRDPETK